MRPKYTNVRARSENEGSGTVGWSLAAPVPACFLLDKDDIPALFCQSNLSQRKPLIVGRSVALVGHDHAITLRRLCGLEPASS